ncbi:hypothetical protein PPYR_08128, partial [Photinus pyralis]
AEIQKFLKEAPISQYFLMKVVVIKGITGACRCDEMHKMLFQHVKDTGTQLVATIPQENEKTNKRRTFSAISEDDGVNYLEICRQYETPRYPGSVQDSRVVRVSLLTQTLASRGGVYYILGEDTVEEILPLLTLTSTLRDLQDDENAIQDENVDRRNAMF